MIVNGLNGQHGKDVPKRVVQDKEKQEELYANKPKMVVEVVKGLLQKAKHVTLKHVPVLHLQVSRFHYLIIIVRSHLVN